MAASAAGANVAQVRRHVIDTWLGFLGSAKPNFIDTSLLGNVRISITLAGTDIIGLKANAGAFAKSYTVDQQAFSVDVISIGDGFYDGMVDQMLASGAPMEIPFKNYFSYSGDLGNGAVPFNVASYALLTMMVAKICDLRPKEFVHTFGDLHLYANHLEQAKLQLSREPRTPPRMLIHGQQDEMTDFRFEDFELTGYDPHPAIKAPIAV